MKYLCQYLTIFCLEFFSSILFILFNYFENLNIKLRYKGASEERRGTHPMPNANAKYGLCYAKNKMKN